MQTGLNVCCCHVTRELFLMLQFKYEIAIYSESNNIQTPLTYKLTERSSQLQICVLFKQKSSYFSMKPYVVVHYNLFITRLLGSKVKAC